jgi:HEAT repeat protein
MATLQSLLSSPDRSVRLKAALDAGTYPEKSQVDVLIARCAIEPDFFVRDTLSWALIMHDRAQVNDSIKLELGSAVNQARSQALHTLTKIGDKQNYSLITPEMMFDSDDSVAMTAWRAASLLVPDSDVPNLITILFTQLGRGNAEVQMALSRALCFVGEPVKAPLEEVMKSSQPEIRLHAELTLKLLKNPELNHDFAMEFALRIDILKNAPAIDQNL